MRRLLLLALVLAPLGCFSPDHPACAFQCAESDPKCPDDYQCMPDGYCHYHGNHDVCPFPDAAVPDLATSDLGKPIDHGADGMTD